MIQSDDNDSIEKHVTHCLRQAEGGQLEVPCRFGRVDMITETHIVEVKHVRNYKHALGQIQVYATCFPTKQKRIHLFYNQNEVEELKTAFLALSGFDVSVTTSLV